MVLNHTQKVKITNKLEQLAKDLNQFALVSVLTATITKLRGTKLSRIRYGTFFTCLELHYLMDLKIADT